MHRISVAKNAYAPSRPRPTTGVSETTSKCGGCVRGHTGLCFSNFLRPSDKKNNNNFADLNLLLLILKRKLYINHVSYHFFTRTGSPPKKNGKGLLSCTASWPSAHPSSRAKDQRQFAKSNDEAWEPICQGFLSLIKFPMFRVVCFNPWYLNTRFLLEKKSRTVKNYPSVG